MLWSFVLPFQITCLVMIVFVAVASIAAPLLRWKRWNMLGLSLVLASVAFIPSCTGIMAVLDTQRFGVFQHASFDDVNNPRIEFFLPPEATNITLEASSGGYRTRYSISQPELVNHVNSIWAKYSKQATNKGDKATFGTPGQPFLYADTDDPSLGPPLTNPLVYEGPRAANGAGFTIWYSVEDGVAYQETAYW